MDSRQKRTWAEVSLDNIEYNYRKIRSVIPDSCRFLGVVKADAYGHGALEVSKRLQECGADYLAVSCLDEALELRSGGIKMPILILGHTPSKYTKELIDNDLTQTVTNLAKARKYSAKCAELNAVLKIHIKVDTGMSRLGYLCEGEMFNEGVDNIAMSCALEGLYPEGIYTHFAVSDEEGEENEKYTLSQFDLFMCVISSLAASGINFDIRHCANSGAVVNYPQMTLDMVRPGLLLYGYGDNGKLGLKPCMRFVTTISTIKYFEKGTTVSYGRRYETQRRTRMGILGVGYADGLPRLASGKCSFMTPYGEAPQCGTICMDMCMIDLSDVYNAAVGDEVELFGPGCPISKLSDAAMTIPYELLCSVTKRVPRIYT